MQVGKLSLLTNFKEAEFNKVKSPTQSISKVENIFDDLPKNNGELINAFSSMNVANSKYTGQIALLEIAKGLTDSITNAYNGKLVDVTSTEREHSSSVENINLINNSIETIKTSISGTQAILGNYVNQISDSSNKISNMDSQIYDVEKDVAVNQAIVDNHYGHSQRKKDLSSGYNNALSSQNSFINSIKSVETGMRSIDAQLEVLNSINSPEADNARQELMLQRKELEDKFNDLCKKLDDNNKIISDFEESQAYIEQYDQESIGQISGKISVLKANKQELRVNKATEEAKLMNLQGKQSIVDAEFRSANNALDTQNVRLQIAEQNELKLHNKMYVQNEELAKVETRMNGAISDYNSEKNNTNNA
jgi:chromosome segregation ATPase